MTIEQVLMKIVERARWQQAVDIQNNKKYVMDITYAIVHALLNSEEVEIRLKVKENVLNGITYPNGLPHDIYCKKED